ncbi:hypothetical protein EYF80_029047 [Liparis tanakae]|uniref:Uncharacterized protein n=1 Tax=Liparis tanakae TaxID=230148 RepID=A0A4Z2H6R0_9TELE|nr:hypothetical protein EYF80_029047 [Liparis tanakae]
MYNLCPGCSVGCKHGSDEDGALLVTGILGYGSIESLSSERDPRRCEAGCRTGVALNLPYCLTADDNSNNNNNNNNNNACSSQQRSYRHWCWEYSAPDVTQMFFVTFYHEPHKEKQGFISK